MRNVLAALVLCSAAIPPLDAASPTPSNGHAYRHAYYLFLAEQARGCEDCYVPLLITSARLEDPAKATGDDECVVITTYARDSIWKIERSVPLSTADIQSAERRVRIRERQYRYQEIGAAEVLRLLEDPAGTIPIHRITAPPSRDQLEDLIASFRALP